MQLKNSIVSKISLNYVKRTLKNLFASLCTTTLIFSPLGITQATEIDAIKRIFSYAVAEDPQSQLSGLHLYKISTDGAATLLQKDIFQGGGPGNNITASDIGVDNLEGKIYFREGPRGDGSNKLRVRVFDVKTETITGWKEITGLGDGAQPIFVPMPDLGDEKIQKKCTSSDGTTCSTNDEKSISLGGSDMEVVIDSEGISVDGKDLIKETSTGEVHIGENSLVTRERNGRQQLYATDANGNKIPIDVTNGSKLLINGRDVEQSINNVGALSAALTGLPTVPTDTTLSCGVGTGTHGGSVAFSGGCASKVNNSLSVNYAASINLPGQAYAGDFEDTFSARAGFIWKLGKPVNSELISMKEKELQTKIISLEEQNQELLARLERIEKVALGKVESKDLASNTINFREMNKRLNLKKINK